MYVCMYVCKYLYVHILVKLKCISVFRSVKIFFLMVYLLGERQTRKRGYAGGAGRLRRVRHQRDAQEVRSIERQ